MGRVGFFGPVVDSFFSEGFEVGAPSFPVLDYGKGGVLRPVVDSFFSEGLEVGAPSFPVLVQGKGGVLRPRFRLCFLHLPQTFTFVRIIK